MRGLQALGPVQSVNVPEASPVKRKTSVGWRVNASPFCKHFGIRIDSTERFTNPEIRDGRLILKLGETVTIRQIRPPKKKS